MVKLKGRLHNYESYISFVVRDDARPSDILFQRSVTTDQAYNNYPGLVNGDTTAPENGKSLYQSTSYGLVLPGSSTNPQQARKVSFNRPYNILTCSTVALCAPGYVGRLPYETAGGTLFSYDFNMIRWLEKEGYDVTYSTNIDTHAADTNGSLTPGRHKVFLSVGHDEYWSWEMRDNIEEARNDSSQPLNLGFFTGNAVYWQVRFEESSSASQPANALYRTMVGYKNHFNDSPPDNDPFYDLGNPVNNHKATNKWRQNYLNSGYYYKPPEDELIGVMFSEKPFFCCSSVTANIASTAPSWITQGMTFGQPLTELIGYEADRLHDENVYTDRLLQVVGDTPFLGGENSHMTFYTRNTLNTNNARAFATGSIQWSWGLDNFKLDSAGPVFNNPNHNPDAERLTKNVLGCLINGVCS